MFKLSFNRLLGKQRDNPEEAIFQDIEDLIPYIKEQKILSRFVSCFMLNVKIKCEAVEDCRVHLFCGIIKVQLAVMVYEQQYLT
jgi:hypothetical protein